MSEVMSPYEKWSVTPVSECKLCSAPQEPCEECCVNPSDYKVKELTQEVERLKAELAARPQYQCEECGDSGYLLKYDNYGMPCICQKGLVADLVSKAEVLVPHWLNNWPRTPDPSEMVAAIVRAFKKDAVAAWHRVRGGKSDG